MSCLRLRLPPAKRAWKSITSKIQSKLYKPKGIHKPRRNRVNTITGTAAAASVRLRPYKFLQLRFQRKPRLALRFPFSRHKLLHNHHHPAHVYVDRLFKETAGYELAKCPPSTSTKYIKPANDHHHHPEPGAVPGSTSCRQSAAASHESVTQSPTCAEDDIWESLGYASPLMQGIDERAEEFIARFRAEMEDQEKLARGL